MKNQNWYVRRGRELKGPFPAGLVSRYILLGRIRLNDELSQDREVWQRAGELTELIPEVMLVAARNPGDEQAQQALEAARRWADERTAAQPAGAERRAGEDPATVSHRQLLAEREAERGESKRWPQYLTVALVVAAVFAVPLLLPKPMAVSEPDCAAEPAPQVNWSGCRMEGRDLANVDLAAAILREAHLGTAVLRAANLRGADLSYGHLAFAQLRGANLEGANLTGADLRGADLSFVHFGGANLAYADLTGSQREGIDLTGARLDHAIWERGVECLPGSVGVCRMPETAP